MTTTGTPATTARDAWVPPANGRLLADRYRLIGQIGRGGSSVVWRAHDDVLDRPVAVKMLSHADDAPLRRRLRSEARACGRLNHPRIAQIFDYGETGATGTAVTPYIVMELVDGEPLSHRLTNGAALDWTTAVSIAGHVAEGLCAAHARGFVHRDIKPGNVMITRSGVKLVDFGICATVGSPDADEDGQFVGTPAYVAPEGLIDAPVDAAADVYALGVLLYRMLAGALPWRASTTTELIAAHMWTEPAPLPPIEGLPPEVADLCAACMDKQPHRRPSSAEAVRILAQFSAQTSSVPASVFVFGDGDFGNVDGSDDVAAQGTEVNETVARTRSWTGLVQAPALRHTRRRRRGMVAAVAVISTALLATAWATGGTPARATNTIADPIQCAAVFSVLRDWGTGFAAKLTMTNTSHVGLHVDQLTFTFPGTQSLQPDPHTGDHTTTTSTDGAAYTVMMAQSGSTVTAHGDTEQLLQPDTAVTVPIRASYRVANPLPMLFSLNGHPCQTQVAGASSPTPTPSPTPATATSKSTGAPGRQSTGHGQGHGKPPRTEGHGKGKGE